LVRDVIPYALGALLLGILGFVTGDFALQWQPVPAGVPLRVPLAYLSAAVLVAGGSAVLWRKTLRVGALVLGLFYGICWVVLLQLPRVLAHLSDVSVWLGFGESLTHACGGLVAWAMYDTDASRRRLVVRVLRVAFGACLLIFGLSHFVYAQFTATMIPSWLPAPFFWVYLTGSGHLAAGVSMISGVLTRLAATLVAAMLACFVVLLHLPRVLAAPTSRVEWTMLGVATSLTGAAWIIRTAIARQVTES